MHTRSLNSCRWLAPRAALALAALPLLGVAATRAQNAPAAPAGVAVAPAGEAIRLRTHWTPGETLAYGMSLEGNLNLQASPNAAGNPLAGVPLDVDLKMTGDSALEALSVDGAGTARVVPRLNALKMQASAFMINADLTLQDGRLGLAVNGQPMVRGDRNAPNAPFLSNPPFALEISDQGRITGAIPRDAAGVAPAPGAPAKEGARPGAGAAPGGVPGLDWAKLAQSMFWRAVPTLWPDAPVKSGDAWAQDVSIPLPDAQAPVAGVPVPTQLGHFDFVMRGLEQVAGSPEKAARISVKGQLSLDAKTSRAIADAARAEAPQVAPEMARQAGAAANRAAARQGDWETQLSKATQKVEGDLWVDPASGHIVRAEMTLDTQTSTTEVARPGAKPKGQPGNSFYEFTGTLQMQLKSRTVKPAA